MTSATYNHTDRPCYSFALSQGSSEVDVQLDATTVEAAVASKLTINPVLEGANLFLKFSSHGGGMEESAENGFVYSSPRGVLDLVEEFLSGSDLKSDQPELFAEAVVELEQHLRLCQRMVWTVARSLGAIPDPMTPGYMPAMSPDLRAFWDIWAKRNFPNAA